MGNCITNCILNNTNDKKIKKFTLKGKTYRAKVVDIYDGDTITVLIRYRLKTIKFKVRMLGYDSPEMRPLWNNPNRFEIKKSAIKAKIALQNKIINKIVNLECGDFDKYGRLLGTVYINGGLCESSININQWMIYNGFGYKYNGGTKNAGYH